MTSDLELSSTLDDYSPLAEIESWADCARGNWPAPASGSALPRIEPGQIWLVEIAPGGAGLADFERHALRSANVVVYDRSLTAAIAVALPLGGYAEAAAPSNGTDRCVGFARDRWSVVRAIEQGSSRAHAADRLREFSGRLLARGIRADLPVSLIGPGRRLDTCLAAVDALVNVWLRPGGSVALVCGALESGNQPRLHAVATNGLAG